MTEPIDAHTRVGRVALTVADLEREMAFYQGSLGFERIAYEPERLYAVLGAGGVPLLVLQGLPGAKRVAGTTGLYHFAIRMPSRIALAHELYQLVERKAHIQGVADHGVSESLYLADPGRNGIEIYADRPQDDWPVAEDGSLMMGTDPLDVDGLVAELAAEKRAVSVLPPGTDIGHVHLHVADLQTTADFYVGVLGFDLVQEYGDSAMFFSAGGYHHHIGANIWAGAGAPPPPPDAAGLRWYELVLPNQSALDAVLERIRAAGLPVEEREEGLLVRDPSQNGILLSRAA